MSLAQFNDDLENKGKPCEAEVLAHIKKWDKEAYLIDGYDPEKDIVAPTLNKTFEVKNCQDAVKNVPIEIRIVNKKGGHESGLNVSRATYWVIYCKATYYMIATDTLRTTTNDIPSKVYTIHDQQVTLKILPIEQLVANTKHSWQTDI